LGFNIDIAYNFFTIVAAAIVFAYGFKKSAQNQLTLALTLLITGGILLRFNVILDPFLHAWDERYHILVAQNTFGNWLKPTLYKNPIVSYDYTSWVGNHIWVHKQPFPIWMMAAFSWLSPTTEWVYRLPSLLLSTLGIWYTYRIGDLLFNHKTGYLAAFLFAIHGLILEVTGGRVATDHFDLYFLVLVTMSVWFGIKPNGNRLFNFALSGVFLGCAILTKWLPALILFPILCIHWFPKVSIKEWFLRCIGVGTIAILIAVPWQLFIWHHYPLEAAWEHAFNAKHVTEALEGQGGPFYYHFDKMRMLFGDLIYLPILWLIYRIFSKNQKIELLLPYALLIVWILIPFIFFSFVETKMQGYTLFTAPSIFITTSCFFYFLKDEITPTLSGIKKWFVLTATNLKKG
jgi:4-amino-4-deoxy-L-arabinose transferase